MQGKHNAVQWVNLHPTLQQRLTNTSSKIKEALGLNASYHRYVTAHWRRGDALVEPGMCLSHKTVNCQETEVFITHLQKETKNIPGHIVYVATNEKNVTELNKLKFSGFHLYSDINLTAEVLLPSIPPSLKHFLIDIMLMCDREARPLFFGITLVERLIKRCRESSM